MNIINMVIAIYKETEKKTLIEKKNKRHINKIK